MGVLEGSPKMIVEKPDGEDKAPHDPPIWIKQAEAAIPKLSDGWFAYARNPNTFAWILARIILFPIVLSNLGQMMAGRGGGLVGLVVGMAAMVPPAMIVAILFLITYGLSAWRCAPAQTRLHSPDKRDG